jgi:type I restriction enzyme, S subunit
MMKTNNIPKLRFPEFGGNWNINKFRDIVKINQGLQIPISERFLEKVEDSYFYITNEFLRERSEKKYFIKNPSQSVICSKDDILMTRTGNTGMVVTNVEGAFHNNFFKISYPNNIAKQYLFYFLKLPNTQKQITRLAGTSTIPDLNHSDFYNIDFISPTLPEQQKIASFLTTVDDKISNLKQKVSLLEKYKKGVMQQIFSQQIRFKDENGNDYPDWEEKSLGEIAVRITQKNQENNLNVLTISAQFGLISQLSFFNKSVSAKNLSGYYLLSKNDFAYNKSYSNGYPMGAIKRLNKYDKGVVSTLYICFRFNHFVDFSFMEHYFETGLQNKEIEKIAQEGARNHGLLNISVKDFFSITMIIPTLKEQTKIAEFLTGIDEKIETTKLQLSKMEVWKKGLLQGMFC